MKVINSQWLYSESATLVKETAKTMTVLVEGKKACFWKDSGLQLGHTKIVKRGDEPNRLVMS